MNKTDQAVKLLKCVETGLEEGNEDYLIKVAEFLIKRATSDKLMYKGQEIKDIHKIYERFNEWITNTELS